MLARLHTGANLVFALALCGALVLMSTACSRAGAFVTFVNECEHPVRVDFGERDGYPRLILPGKFRFQSFESKPVLSAILDTGQGEVVVAIDTARWGELDGDSIDGLVIFEGEACTGEAPVSVVPEPAEEIDQKYRSGN